MRASLILSLVGLGLIVWTTEPLTASLLLKTLFFTALFIFVWSIATLAIFTAKNKFLKSGRQNSDNRESTFQVSLISGLFLSIIVMAVILIRRLD